LDDDEIDFIADRILFVMEGKDAAIAFVEEEGIDELDKEKFGSLRFDEDEVDRFIVDQDHDDIKVLKADFEDGDMKLELPVRFEHDRDDFKANVIVEFKDGEIDDMWFEDFERR